MSKIVEKHIQWMIEVDRKRAEDNCKPSTETVVNLNELSYNQIEEGFINE